MNCSKMHVDQPRLLAASLVSLLFCSTSCSTSGDATPDQGSKPNNNAAQGGSGAGTNPSQNPGTQGPADERVRFLIQKYQADARQFMADGKLEEARLAAIKAKELNPGNTETLELLSRIAAELKEPSGSATSYSQQVERMQKINEERQRAEVETRLQSSKAFADQGNFESALQELRIAKQNIEVGRLVDWGPLTARVDTALAETTKARDEKDRARIDAEVRETQAKLREIELASNAEQRARVQNLNGAAAHAFEIGKYAWAQELTREAMSVDPNDAVARDLHDASTKALRESNKTNYIEEKRREITKLMEANEDLKIPQTDILRMDDAVWARANGRVVATTAESKVTPEDTALNELIAQKTVGKVSFTEETGAYAEVVKTIATITNLPIILTPEAKNVISTESLVLKLTLIAPLPLRSFLDQMCSKSENLAWRVANGVIEITSKAKAGGDTMLVTKDVRDLVFPVTEFVPPTIRDIPNGQAEAGGQSRAGGEQDAKVAYIDGDGLVNSVKEATGAKYWEGEGGGTIEYAEGGYLIVKANAKTLKKIDQILEDYRRFATAVVTIESKFLTTSRNFLQEVGVDFRGLGGAGNKGSNATLDDITNGLDDNSSRGLDNSGTSDPAGKPSSGAFYNDGGDGDVRARTENFFNSSLGKALSGNGGLTASWAYLNDLQLQMILRAVEKREEVQVVNSQRITVINNERANVAVLNQTSYVRDFDVEVAQAAFIADPKVDVIQDGVVLDVKPVIAYDRKHVMLQLQPTVAELQRPIPTFTTSLAGSTLPVTLQLPTINVKTFATTATVPDGGSVLLGGLREVVNRERRAEVPILSKLPIVSFLFKQEGVSDENSSLMVLVRATITDVREAVEKRQVAK